MTTQPVESGFTACARASRARAVVTLGLLGDTMLGRLVAERLAADLPDSLIAPEVVAVAHEADLFVLNLECCISGRGERWPAPDKRFFFRAPPAAVDVLTHLGVDCVTLANNHALDYGPVALLDTFTHLERAGIAWVGAGANVARAHAPVTLEARGYRLTVLAATDHPADYAAGPDRPGVAWADLRHGVPAWLLEAVGDAASSTATAETPGGVLVTPHWGPNMVAAPVSHVRRAAAALRGAGATLVAGHSAHVFHGVDGPVLYDVGDFLDDYATDPLLRNDLGLLVLVELDEHGPVRLEAVPLALEFCHTRLASCDEAAWIARRFQHACATFGTDVRVERDRLVITWR
jgi:poly-gamma-glutamate capsule biosynthesis protein CapA/YwtB (metallophosphatase superfamily)